MVLLSSGLTLIQSHFYPVQQATAKGERIKSLFSTLDEDFHTRYKRCLNSAFAMSSLVSYEPLVDSTMEVFLEKTEEMFARTGKACDFPKWLHYFAFDVIGDLTWSKRIGFVERDEDVDGIIAFINGFFDYAGPVGFFRQRLLNFTDRMPDWTDSPSGFGVLEESPHPAGPANRSLQESVCRDCIRAIPVERSSRGNGKDQSQRPAA